MKQLAKQELAGAAPRVISVLGHQTVTFPHLHDLWTILSSKTGRCKLFQECGTLIITDKSHQGTDQEDPDQGNCQPEITSHSYSQPFFTAVQGYRWTRAVSLPGPESGYQKLASLLKLCQIKGLVTVHFSGEGSITSRNSSGSLFTEA